MSRVHLLTLEACAHINCKYLRLISNSIAPAQVTVEHRSKPPLEPKNFVSSLSYVEHKRNLPAKMCVKLLIRIEKLVETSFCRKVPYISTIKGSPLFQKYILELLVHRNFIHRFYRNPFDNAFP